ncbi:glycosyltransferase [Sinomonas halotolerans]|uniref:Nucleotide disphospho-sugar-binding domain-containing protein n=1 Tax=Sinomonas halotolerans TaxID=1644133 RepID=A0ABU9X1K6_9MICC
MKALLAAFGTRGDIEPFLALGERLSAEGHTPVLAVPRRLAGLAHESGLAVQELDDGLLADADALSYVPTGTFPWPGADLPWGMPGWVNRASHGAALPERVEAFLDAGEPPVYIGFGSMAGPDPEATTRACLEAAELAGVRAVIATGWGGLSEVPDSGRVLAVEHVPHTPLFPRVAAVVHHGGAGTTAAAARAGRPQVLCPFVADQPFWARRMHALGVAARPLPQRRLTADGLASRLAHAMDDAGIRARAAALGEAARAEDGVGAAVAALAQLSR